MVKKITLAKKLPVACHTKHIGPGSTFIAIKGCKQDGVDYIPKALKRGASKVVIQHNATIGQEIQNMLEQNNIDVELVENTRLALACMSEKASNYAHKKLKIIGITGTKGKTSTAFILEHLLRSAGHSTALISTVHNKILHTTLQSNLTTEQPDYLHHFFALCVNHEIEYVIMEVAAQALSLHRVANITFDAVIFTNFSQEHGEFYNTLNDYFKAKCSIFNQLKQNAHVLVNTDDQWGKQIVHKYQNFSSFGLTSHTDISATIIDADHHLKLAINHINDEHKTDTISCPAIFGAFNAYNLLGAIGIANKLDISRGQCAQYMKSFTGIPGRLQMYTLKNNARCFIDYAHNPSSHAAVLSTLRSMTDDLIVIFGAGGERDHAKRPIMGHTASNIANTVILTSDNPRTEDPYQIIEDIYTGIITENQHKIHKEVDRKIAIEHACNIAKSSSIIAILGKGPDEYQEIKGRKYFFSEKEIIKNL